MDPATFAQIRIRDHFECCRLCSHVHRYQKDDYYFAPGGSR
jgi:hypothetical protein